jgi:hypothetical protein
MAMSWEKNTRDYLNSPERVAERKARNDGTAYGADYVNYDPNDPRAKDAYRDRMGFGGQEGGAATYAERARGRAESSGARPTYQGSEALQGHQGRSLDALAGAASGTAPSQAAILAQRQSDASVNAAQSAAGSVKGGPGARAAAMRAAMSGQAMQQQAGAREAAAARANEMDRARGAYAGASGAALANDQGNEARGRAMNDERERFYEELGYNVQKTDQSNQLDQEKLATERWKAGREERRADEGFNWDKVGKIYGSAAGAAMGIGKMFMSDARAKKVIPYGSLAPMMRSDEKTKDKSSLDDAMESSFDGRDEGVRYGYLSDPYTREPEKGVAGAPRGYAAKRAGQAGDMFGGGEAEEPAKEDGAPGTNDWLKYGAGGEAEQHATLGNLMRSDPRAKREAYEMGRADTLDQIKTNPEHGVEVEEAKRRWRERAYMDDPDAKRSIDEVAEEASKNLGDEYRDQDRKQAETEKKAREYQKKYAAMAAAEKAAAAPAPPPKPAEKKGLFASLPDVRALLRSDMKSKEERTIDLDEVTIDLDEPEGTAMRDGPSDPEAYSAYKREQRGVENARTGRKGREDMKRELRGQQDKAGKDADALLASFKARGKEGPAVDAKRESHVPDAAMFAAMKSMEPSVYAYKPEFRPLEQKPGELQAGPMADKMERDPIAGMTIVREPKTGLRAIDKDKALKLTMGSLAVLANDVEKMKRKKKGGS